MTDPVKIPVEPEGEGDKKHGNNKGHKWQPGESGNPNGRPKKGYSITDAFKSLFEANPEIKAQVVAAIKEKALAGDMAAAKMVWEYMDGKPKASPEDPGTPENPIQHSITVKFG